MASRLFLTCVLFQLVIAGSAEANDTNVSSIDPAVIDVMTYEFREGNSSRYDSLIGELARRDGAFKGDLSHKQATYVVNELNNRGIDITPPQLRLELKRYTVDQLSKGLNLGDFALTDEERSYAVYSGPGASVGDVKRNKFMKEYTDSKNREWAEGKP